MPGSGTKPNVNADAGGLEVPAVFWSNELDSGTGTDASTVASPDSGGAVQDASIAVDAKVSPAPSRDFCDAVTTVLIPHCGGGSCHSNPSPTIGDFAIDQDHVEAFVDRDSAWNPACGKVINSREPSLSLILTKVTGDFPSSGCGGFMPVTGDDLSSRQIECLADWVEQFQR